jgi:hypothetical protein
MMHLTTNTAATAIRPAPESLVAIDRHGCKHRIPKLTGRHHSIRRQSVFCSGMANFLEERRATFHNSAIGDYATISLTFGYAGIP